MVYPILDQFLSAKHAFSVLLHTRLLRLPPKKNGAKFGKFRKNDKKNLIDAFFDIFWTQLHSFGQPFSFYPERAILKQHPALMAQTKSILKKIIFLKYEKRPEKKV